MRKNCCWPSSATFCFPSSVCTEISANWFAVFPLNSGYSDLCAVWENLKTRKTCSNRLWERKRERERERLKHWPEEKRRRDVFYFWLIARFTCTWLSKNGATRQFKVCYSLELTVDTWTTHGQKCVDRTEHYQRQCQFVFSFWLEFSF